MIDRVHKLFVVIDNTKCYLLGKPDINIENDLCVTDETPHEIKSDEIINFCRICADAESDSAQLQKEIRIVLMNAVPLFSKWTSCKRKQTADNAIWLTEALT